MGQAILIGNGHPSHKIFTGERPKWWHHFAMRRARRLLGWRFRLITVVVAYTTFFGAALVTDFISSMQPMAPASVAKMSVPADALIAAVATVFTFAVVALTSSRTMR